MKPELPELVASNIEYFVGRTWLLSHILKWLDESNQRLLILKGAPGTGKSTVLAWLAGTGPLLNDSNAKGQLEKIRSKVKASHFLMSNTGNIAPKAFAESIARQLTQNINQFGQLMINSLDRGRIQINPIQNVGRAQSVVAVNIAKLDLGGLTDEFSFDSVFRAPLKQLYRSGYNETILLLVDALDEAMTYKGGITVVQLLSKLADLPKDVRIIVTTRDDPRVLKNYTDTNIKPFDIIEDAPSTIDDVKSYTSNRLVDLGKRPLRQILAEKVSDGAGGNFLYAHLVINDLLKRLPSLKESKHIEFPTGLGGLYHKFLNRELGVDEDRWFDIFKPLLGLIAIAQGEGLI